MTLAQAAITLAIFALMAIIDVFVTPALLAAPAILVMMYVPTPWNTTGLLLLVLPGSYMVGFLFIRDTDDAWPFGPAERFVWNRYGPETKGGGDA